MCSSVAKHLTFANVDARETLENRGEYKFVVIGYVEHRLHLYHEGYFRFRFHIKIYILCVYGYDVDMDSLLQREDVIYGMSGLIRT